LDCELEFIDTRTTRARERGGDWQSGSW